MILITGVAGFLGRTLAQYFYEKGEHVVGIDVVSSENSPRYFLKDYLQCNLPDRSFTSFIEKNKPDICIHCAGRASVNASLDEPFDDYKNGPLLTEYILDRIHKVAPECKFIFLSSAAVYGNPKKLPIGETCEIAPISPYGFNKWQSEIICQEYSQIYQHPTAIARVFSAYGPGLRRQVIWDICQKAISEKTLKLRGKGNESRDFIHSFDIAQGLDKIISNGSMNAEVYNLAHGSQINILELAKLVLHYLKLDDKKIEFDNVAPTGNPINWEADIDKICDLGFSPKIDFTTGISSYVTWFLSVFHVSRNE